MSNKSLELSAKGDSGKEQNASVGLLFFRVMVLVMETILVTFGLMLALIGLAAIVMFLLKMKIAYPWQLPEMTDLRQLIKQEEMVRSAIKRLNTETGVRREAASKQAWALLGRIPLHSAAEREGLRESIHQLFALLQNPNVDGSSDVTGHLPPEAAEQINSDDHLGTEWGSINADIQRIYEVLGPPPLKTLAGDRDGR